MTDDLGCPFCGHADCVVHTVTQPVVTRDDRDESDSDGEYLGKYLRFTWRREHGGKR